MDLLKLIQNFAQDCIAKRPVIVLGSGASAGHGIPGMWPLGQELKNSALPSDITPIELEGWNTFCNRIQEIDLETALTEISITEKLTKHIVTTTWEFLNAADLKLFQKITSDRQYLPLTQLFRHLFQSTTTDIQVVTPNYDRLAEYAAEAGGYMAYTGFTYGMLGLRAGVTPPKVHTGRNPNRTVNIWKVHGSFGWFHDANDVVISLPPTSTIPIGMFPVIVTPGVEKYRLTHDEPFRTTMLNADSAIRSATSFLSIGYGFNDSHMQPFLTQRCNTDRLPLLLITKEISSKAHEFFKTGKCQCFLAMEECPSGTKIFCNEYPDGIELNGPPYWQLGEFLNLIR